MLGKGSLDLAPPPVEVSINKYCGSYLKYSGRSGILTSRGAQALHSTTRLTDTIPKLRNIARLTWLFSYCDDN